MTDHNLNSVKRFTAAHVSNIRMFIRSSLRLSTYILKTKHELQFNVLRMSSHKIFSENSNSSSPCKIRCDKKTEIVQNSIKNTTIIDTNKMHFVEVMETPDKSENDKKSYRVIRLQNELKVLLISDPTQSAATDESESNEHHHEVTSTSEGEEETESEQSGDEHDDEDDHSYNEKRGKLAACSLCVDVGSFSDPREVQGLAHFLGKINISFNCHLIDES